MKPKLFPSHFNLILNESERSALDRLYNLDPHLVDEIELVHRALQAGIRVLNAETAQKREDPHLRGPTRTDLQAQSNNPTTGPPLANRRRLPLAERIARRLEAFIRANPDVLPEEEASAMLIDLGLSHQR